jgi:hypothetical protein
MIFGHYGPIAFKNVLLCIKPRGGHCQENSDIFLHNATQLLHYATIGSICGSVELFADRFCGRWLCVWWVVWFGKIYERGSMQKNTLL